MCQAAFCLENRPGNHTRSIVSPTAIQSSSFYTGLFPERKDDAVERSHLTPHNALF